MEYDRRTITLGEGFPLQSAWTDDAGNPADPDIQVMYVKDPLLGTTAVYRWPGDNIFSEVDVGEWVFPFTAATAGRWRWRWEAYGTVHDVWEGEVLVLASGTIGAATLAVPAEPVAPTTDPAAAPAGGNQGGTEPPP